MGDENKHSLDALIVGKRAEGGSKVLLINYLENGKYIGGNPPKMFRLLYGERDSKHFADLEYPYSGKIYHINLHNPEIEFFDKLDVGDYLKFSLGIKLKGRMN